MRLRDLGTTRVRFWYQWLPSVSGLPAVSGYSGLVRRPLVAFHVRRMLTRYTVDASLPTDNASPFELLDLTGIVAKVPVKYLFVMLAQERRFQIKRAREI